jgi:hypothetical protein
VATCIPRGGARRAASAASGVTVPSGTPLADVTAMATKRHDGPVEPMRDVHVVRHYDGWATKRDGGVRVSRLADNQEDAIQFGRRMAMRDKVDLVVHDVEGNVQFRHSYRARDEAAVSRLSE